jgi:hypothetical protein
MKPVFRNTIYLRFIVLLFTFSCQEQTTTQQFSYPSWSKISRIVNKNSIAVFSVGDFTRHDQVHLEMRKIDQNKDLPISLKIGGNSVRQSYIKIIKNKLNDRAIIVSSSQVERPLNLSPAANEVTLDGIGFPLSFFKSKQAKKELSSSIPWINSNILKITTSKPFTPSNVSKHKITKSQVKILAINAPKEVKKLKPSESVGFYFQDEVSTLLKNKNKGLTVVLYNGDTTCHGHHITKPTSFTKKKSMTIKCDPNDRLLSFVNRLPPNTIDLIVLSSSKIGAGFIDNIPVLFSGNSRDFIYPIILNKRRKDNMSYFVPGIKLCHKVFASTKDCVYEVGDKELDEARLLKLQKRGHGLIPAMFLGHEITK